jgi:THO complex subunit 1
MPDLVTNYFMSIFVANMLQVKWATESKRSIADYLKQGFEGPFFHRMVETVLTRDKNWVRWKIENCPPIERPTISADDYLSAKATAKKSTANKRLRPKAMGSLELGFLTEVDGLGSMEKLKNPAKYDIPSLESFKNKIAEDDLEIEMPTNDETKEAAVNGKASKSWRALRIASKTKLISFDKIEDPDKIDLIFEEIPVEAGSAKEDAHDAVDIGQESLPEIKTPLIVSGPGGVGKGTLVKALIDKYPSTFGKKVSHTTRAPRADEEDGVHYYFVTKENFDVIRDGDQLLEFNDINGNDYGTSQKVVEGIIASGKIPIMEMDYHVSFYPRYILLYSF